MSTFEIFLPWGTRAVMASACWTDPPREKRPTPCFVCSTEPAMAGHRVCTAHHDEEACRVCTGKAAQVYAGPTARGYGLRRSRGA